MKIKIKEVFKTDYITRGAGEKLRLMILENKKNNKQSVLDFSELTIASTSFFDESLAKLALEGWDKKTYNSFVIIEKINPLDLNVLNKMLKYRNLI